MIYDSDSAFTSTSISILSLVSLKFNSKWQINKENELFRFSLTLSIYSSLIKTFRHKLQNFG